MIRHYITLLILLVYSLLASLFSQEAWSLDDCMRYAVLHNSSVRIRQLNNSNLREERTAARGSLLPAINASMGGSVSFGRSIDPQTNTYSDVSNFNNSYELYGSIPLFQAGALIRKIQISDICLQNGSEALRQQENEIAIKTMQHYLDLFYLNQTVMLAEQQLTNSKRLLRQAEKMEEVGTKSKADVIQIRAQVAADEYNVVLQQNRRDQMLLSLKEVMNFPADEPLPTDSLLPDEMPLLVSDDATLFEAARQTLPQMRISELRVKESRLRVALSKSGFFPTLSLNGGVNTQYYKNLKNGTNAVSFDTQLRNNLGEWIGFTLRIPLFNNLQAVTALRKARNNLHIAREEQSEAMRRWQTEIARTNSDYSGLQKELRQMELKVQADRMAYDVNGKKYEKGLISIFDLQTSANTLLQSEVALVQIQINILINKRMIRFYRGDSLINTTYDYGYTD